MDKETYYLIDFENVHNEGIENIEKLKKTDHVHIFSTQNATNINSAVFWMTSDIQGHLVPIGNQSLDMHLVSYLGYLVGINGKDCSYVVISKDKDYDNIIHFWKSVGYTDISRREKLFPSVKEENKKNNSPIAHKLKGEERSKLNTFIQHKLVDLGYDTTISNRVCKYVIANCNDDHMLNKIHNDLVKEFNNTQPKLYEDVKALLTEYKNHPEETDKKEAKIRSFFGRHFKKKLYVDHKEEIVQIILHSNTKHQVHNELQKIYSDEKVVSHIYSKIEPLISELADN